MVSCVDQVLGMTINGDEGEEVIFADTGIPSPYLQVGGRFTCYYSYIRPRKCMRVCVRERERERERERGIPTLKLK